MYKITQKYPYNIIIFSDLCYGPVTRWNHCLPVSIPRVRTFAYFFFFLYAKLQSAATIFFISSSWSRFHRPLLPFHAIFTGQIRRRARRSAPTANKRRKEGRWNRDAARPYLYTFNKDSINGRKSYRIGDEWFLLRTILESVFTRSLEDRLSTHGITSVPRERARAHECIAANDNENGK